ncbi:MAG: glutamate dehydrogenase [Novosphingobium sp. 28-62-57]|uniref:NAD-glutamate dehydrogenase domain-containing protein n=1 Tax=Novosphingobium sp. 28-62-57 TaxID=1970409 RepID=UPI000BC70FA0|nr:NAD-glutamate dehydrogenase domain-containing protein [Novosphingobium sp. 28-62-57]OYW50326.1 MAG: glutamate dehydrogenase [Novosphingobium sp. 12-62-10]OYZ11571.1 MAG: glutamate dehydrogenase [Novosphingobium sp. 28-62-57]HQS70110.1 NAD-glutamate dehydrogenase [Novosphingobium sp.]
MASTSATLSDSADVLAFALAERFAAALLPDEARDFDTARLAEAARFTATAASVRKGSAPAIAIESVSGSGSAGRHLRLAVINDDMPFLVDSITSAITAQGLTIDRLVHPVTAVRRDADGRLTDLPAGDASGERRESIVYLETERADARQRRALLAALEETLADVRAAVADWPTMQAAMRADADSLADPEGAALLRWLADGMLTQLGCVTRLRDGTEEKPLGICRASDLSLLADASYDRAFAWFESGKGRAPLIVKANRIANVHRRVPLDLFIVPRIEGGAVVALSIHAGVWTSAALAAAPDRIPRLRTQLSELMDKFGFAPNGHAGKALVHAMTALPHDLLISFAEADLERVVTATMSLVDRPRPRLALVEAPLARHMFAFVWLPRDVLSTQMRLAIQATLESAAGAQVIDWALQVEASTLAMLRFVLDVREQNARADEDALDLQLQSMVRGWAGAVEAELAKAEDPSRAAAIAARFADAFPIAYRNAAGPAEAASDIRVLRTLAGSRAPRRAARLHRHAGEVALRLKLYQREGAIVLSDAVPVLENFGFRVLEEIPTPLDGGRLGYIHDFLVSHPADTSVDDLLARAASIEGSLAAVLNGAAEDDAFNRLIVATGLTATEANWLRAFYRYLRQAGLTFSIATVVEALKAAPAVTRGLIDAFVARHDPAFTGERDAAFAQAEEHIKAGLSGVAAINDDRLLRQFRALVNAILRTNAFAPAATEALAFKIDSSMVPGLPKPLPWREIFVYSPRIEGIHLRAGPVARGGLRWSDRRDDFRTEVLGLMKAQRVKNAVIVPTGAKGGFYPKQLPDAGKDREGWLAEGKASYQVFIRTLLSLTDNIVDGAVVHPDAVVVRDGEDPYFVVAADKGTATFSDVANAIAESKDFWLDDAFASGGSKGYDHKAMGITAKGAWLSVRRHFLEMGVDVQHEPVRVAGCGDMSGDVFGNGMLLSKALKVVAAFDHRHVFLDPDPDPAKSWNERARLFALPRSSWDDYDKSLISTGGGVFPRSMKAIPLSLAIQAMLDLDVAEIDPDSLITAILRAQVDLMWFGGIGTYVKASAQNNVDVGDPSNDAVRVSANEVRAKVIGEGANLGTTQAARIEFSLNVKESGGGRINTDFIDNSAGVDCSDNEVNIKIALAAAKRTGKLTEDARVDLLVSMTDDVAHLVLEDNRLQALALSIAEGGGAAAMPSWSRLIDVLEESGDLDRKTEGLAGAEDLARRAAAGQGLTRPELAVLLSSSKLALQRALEDSPLVSDPVLEAELVAAFPPQMREAFAAEITAHQLRREIIATKLANRVINRLGPIMPFELCEEEGASLAQVVAAFVAAERLFDLRATWDMLDTAAMPEALRLALFERTALGARGQIADVLRAGHGSVQPGDLIKSLFGGVELLSHTVAQLLRGEAQAQAQAMANELAAAGAPAAIAARLVHLYDMDGAVGLAHLAGDLNVDAAVLTGAFADLGATLGLDWAQQAARRMNPSDPWERLLVAGLSRDFEQMRLDFLTRSRGGAPDGFVADWLSANAVNVKQFRSLVARAQSAPVVAPAMLAQVASQARTMLGR